MYAKVFQQIFHSSISADYLTRHVFMDLLVLADKDGIVDMTPDSIAAVTRVPLQIVTDALRVLSEPDPNSRSADEDGRRIVLLDNHRNWGWSIVNHEKYKLITDDDSRKEYFREYKRKQRQRNHKVKLSKTVRDNPRQSMKVTHIDIDVDVDTDISKNTSCSEPLQARKPNVIFLLPLSDKTFHEVTEQDVSHFTELYPAVSIEQTFRNIIGWLEANPTKRKTRRGVAKFVNGWLSREQDKPHNGENGNGYKKTGLASFFDEYAKTGSAVAD